MNEGFIVLDEAQFEEADGLCVTIRPEVTDVDIFPISGDNLRTLQTLFPDKIILTVEFKLTPDVCVDLTSYESVRFSYNILAKQGFEPADDEAFVRLAATQMSPNKKMFICIKKMGNTAFKGSAVYQHNLKCVRCFDMNLVVNPKKYRDT